MLLKLKWKLQEVRGFFDHNVLRNWEYEFYHPSRWFYPISDQDRLIAGAVYAFAAIILIGVSFSLILLAEKVFLN